jgi:hypothetical protein
MGERSLLRLGSVLVVVPVLIAAACGDSSDGSSGTEPAGGAEPASPAAPLSLSIDAPADGAEVGGQFNVVMTPSVEVGPPDSGLHHVHLYYDGNTAEGAYDMVFGASATVTGLDRGEHLIEAVIVNADHSPTDARAEITVNVADGEGGTTPAVATTFPAYGGY